jgi:ferrous iron transport protein B
VGTLNSLYGQTAAFTQARGAEAASEEFSLLNAAAEAFASIARNLSGLVPTFFDPLGVGSVGDKEAAAAESGMNTDVFARLQGSFSPVGAYAYLIFILLYFPCVAALGAAMRELGRGTGMLLAVYLTVFAWVAAVLVFQIFEGGSVFWILNSVLLAAALAGFFVFFGKKVFGIRQNV